MPAYHYQRAAVRDRHVERLDWKKRHEDRNACRAERTATGASGPEIDWDTAVNRTVDTVYQGVVKTMARGPESGHRRPLRAVAEVIAHPH
jgi:hypothetical protein